MIKKNQIWWCCSAEFGEHESDCPNNVNTGSQGSVIKSQPTPTVAKIAAEVAPDLEDYVQFEPGFSMTYSGYRTADAQAMIERAFAGLEAKPVSADAEQIVQLAWEAIEHGLTYEGVTVGKVIITNAIAAALAPLQAENTELRAELERVGGGK